MSASPFTVAVPPGDKEEIFAFLRTQQEAFAASEARDVSIDLSAVSVLLSNQIGALAQIVKASRGRGGRVVVFAPRSTTSDVLHAVNFDAIVTIVRDRASFDSFFSGETEETAAPQAGPAAATMSTAQKTRKPSRSLVDFYRSNMPLQMGVLAGALVFFLLSGILGAALFLQSSRLRVQAENMHLIEHRLTEQIDSLHGHLKKCEAENRLLHELGSLED